MKQLFLLSSLLLCNVAQAQSMPNTLFDTGFYSGGPWVSKSELGRALNSPGGIPGLDESGNITAPIASGRPVINIAANGATSIPVPSRGDVVIIITASAPSQLQFSGTFSGTTAQQVTLIVVGNGKSVLFPTTNVSPTGSDVPVQADTTAGRYTAVTYRFVPGIPVIQGGV